VAWNYLRRVGPALRLAEVAAKTPSCDFEREWERGPYLSFPEYSAVRYVARLLSVRAVLYADAGEPKKAFADVRTGMILARHVGTDPTIIAMLVRIAIEAIMGRAVEQLVMEHLDDPQFLQEARAAATSCGPLPDVEYHMRAEVVIGRECANMLRRGGRLPESEHTSPATRQPLSALLGRRLMTDAWEARLINYYRSVFRVIRTYKHDPRQLSRALRHLDEQEDAESRRHPMTNLLLTIVRPAMGPTADKITELAARQTVREGLLQIAEVRQRTGRLPRSAEELGALLPRDPFSSRPLVYRPSNTGFLLYSVGRNGKDDGGQIPPVGAAGPPPDITLVYPYQAGP